MSRRPRQLQGRPHSTGCSCRPGPAVRVPTVPTSHLKLLHRRRGRGRAGTHRRRPGARRGLPAGHRRWRSLLSRPYLLLAPAAPAPAAARDRSRHGHDVQGGRLSSGGGGGGGRSPGRLPGSPSLRGGSGSGCGRLSPRLGGQVTSILLQNSHDPVPRPVVLLDGWWRCRGGGRSRRGRLRLRLRLRRRRWRLRPVLARHHRLQHALKLPQLLGQARSTGSGQNSRLQRNETVSGVYELPGNDVTCVRIFSAVNITILPFR